MTRYYPQESDFKPLSHFRVSTHVSTAYHDTKGTSRVRRTYVSIRSSYSSIPSSYSSYAEVLRFLCVHLIVLSHYRVSTHVSTAYQDTKGTLRVRRTYVSIRSSYSSIRSSYSSYAEVLRFFKRALKDS